MSLASLQMPLGVTGYQYEAAAQLAEGLALRVAEALRVAISERGRALLVVSGGRSPVAFFEQLAQQALPWKQVQVGLADERWVPLDDPASNEALVRQHLLQGAAAEACMIGLYRPAESLEQAAHLADQAIASLPAIDVLVLGMGDDGHTASLFPHSPLLDEALRADCPHAVLPMQAPAAPQQRLTLTLPVLAAARLSLLAIQGPAKLATLARALQPGAASELPIRALLKAPLQLHWSP
ncbi:6-phosphogluconolactonase [Pseudomonas sp. Gutcm_11s]|uniref:6-phosphogluconolactonase n=1 Tax=Pseudomonas sp. Gutcm_11s TaxID=3026088 RepID=UPI002361FCE4|nr:6-phosphogluconolactonase [Pseudomonas sp. Gutcm_11s]MDD0843178.1 6-phosphogluconolactonase [Pseudomonas sp. Gutcm_11s]